MEFKIIIPKKVQKEIKKIEKKDQIKIIKTLLSLAKNPFLGKKLKGEYTGYFSLRVWPYRIIYTVKRKKLIVLIVKVGHRQGVY